MEFVFTVIFIAVVIAFFIARAFRGPVEGLDSRLSEIEKNTRRAIAAKPAAHKTCPRCAEEIMGAALVCRYCGHEFDPSTIVLSYSVLLKAAGPRVINVIKLVREEYHLGLKEAKDLVVSAPVVLEEGATPENAARIKALFEEHGAVIELT